MDDSPQQPPPDRLATLIETREFDAASTALTRAKTADPNTRKDAVRAVKEYVENGTTVAPLLPSLVDFLDDEQRAVRLTTAKALVAVAESDPESATDAVSALAKRLADDEEFYYVRGRCAEALGYIAVEYPDEVASPETVADLRLGLEFDAPEVKEKLAKALEHVALGNPGRLSHQVSTLASYLDDDTELVRYHLSTALVIVACEQPTALEDVTESLEARVQDEDETSYVRGRAAEALGLLARATGKLPLPETALETLADEDDDFVVSRAQFAATACGGDGQAPVDVGQVEAIRDRTDEIVEDITTPDADGECPHCGLALPENGPPMCPQCGMPR